MGRGLRDTVVGVMKSAQRCDNELVLEVDAPSQLGSWTCQLDGAWSDEL